MPLPLESCLPSVAKQRSLQARNHGPMFRRKQQKLGLAISKIMNPEFRKFGYMAFFGIGWRKVSSAISPLSRITQYL
jgi:hypothetical protein